MKEIAKAIVKVMQEVKGMEKNSKVKDGGKIVLVKGSPITLYRETGQRFYFDQNGHIVEKFQIKQIPARITQSGLKLLIEELSLGKIGSIN